MVASETSFKEYKNTKIEIGAIATQAMAILRTSVLVRPRIEKYRAIGIYTKAFLRITKLLSIFAIFSE